MTDAAAPPDFPPAAGAVRVVLVLDVLGRVVLVDELRHREVLAALAAWEAQVRAKAGGVTPEASARRKAAGGQPGLFGG